MTIATNNLSKTKSHVSDIRIIGPLVNFCILISCIYLDFLDSMIYDDVLCARRITRLYPDRKTYEPVREKTNNLGSDQV